MIYTQKTKQAIKLCYQAHDGQLDKSGLPSVTHPLHVAEQISNEANTIVALLHDVMEDTAYTASDLREVGFDQEIIDALLLLTHDLPISYMDYIRKLSTNPLARKVKIADLKHNSDLTRLNSVTTEDLKRLEKYKKSLHILESS